MKVLRRLPYREGWELQNRLFEARKQGSIPDVLLLVEHQPVYTFGKSGKKEHLLIPEQEAKRRGIEIFWIDRGGDITYHGPGQLVGYPIFDLHHYYLDVGRFLRDLEEVLIRTLAHFDIKAGRIAGLTGVWVEDKKIASIGVKLSRWITKHGFALNVSTDLHYFAQIIPCGIAEKPMTSMEQVLGRSVTLDEVIPRVLEEFQEVFHLTLKPQNLLMEHSDAQGP